MSDIIQIFASYIGLTLFIGGIFFCFIAVTFRYGVFCTLLGNVFFISSIVFPKQIIQFICKYELDSYFTSIDVTVLKIKAIIAGLIIMVIFWSLRWLKHFIFDGFFVFLFPSVVRPEVKENKIPLRDKKID